MSTRKKFIGGNWKMNGTATQNQHLIKTLLHNTRIDPTVKEVVVAPPAIYLQQVRDLVFGTHIQVAAQNIHHKDKGAFTGEISAPMLRDMSIPWTIIGHSERRDQWHESNDLISAKISLALINDIKVIVAIGEHLEDRQNNKTFEVLDQQMQAIKSVVQDWSKIVVAYEPVFCIGTGIAMEPVQAQEVHAMLRKWLKDNVSESSATETRIIYGGSVNDENCKELAQQPDIDGFLVGGASLKAGSFANIIHACDHHVHHEK